MRNYDLAPLYRSTVGFDRLFSALDQFAAAEPAAASFPPYDIERVAENDYRISLAVAGFSPDELSIETREGVLTVTGERRSGDEPKREFLHRGIAARSFVRRFQLADHVTVSGATVENGLLHVGLVREVPEAAKPRRIEIATANGNAPRVEAPQAAAA